MCPKCGVQSEKTEYVIVDQNTKFVIYFFPCGAKYEHRIGDGRSEPIKLQVCMGSRLR